MIRMLIAGAVGAAVIGGTGAGALALSDSPSTPGSGSSSSSSAPAPGTPGTAAKATKHKRHDVWKTAAKRAVHGAVVVRGKDGTFSTLDFARGKATVSPTSLVVATADGQSVTFTLDSTTKYHVRAENKTSKGSVSSVHDGDIVVVLGKGAAGAATTTATQVLDLGPAK